jgi:putative salt-induced outer membrane protein YdiY
MFKIPSVFASLIFAMTSAQIPLCHAQLDYEIDEGVIVEEVEPAWTGTFAAGLNGKTGNSIATDINVTLDMTRDTDRSTTNIIANYFYGTNDIVTVTDRAFTQFRQERKFSNPKWSWYYQLGLEWDRFKDFDYRIAIHSGLAYMLYDLDDRSLKLRMGAGSSREVGGPNDEWLPELQFGADWHRQLTERTKLYTNLDLYPNVSDFSDYRLNTNAGIEFLLDAEKNINFRLFAINRFDSTPPPGNVDNDLEYGMALVVGF